MMLQVVTTIQYGWHPSTPKQAGGSVLLMLACGHSVRQKASLYRRSRPKRAHCPEGCGDPSREIRVESDRQVTDG